MDETMKKWGAQVRPNKWQHLRARRQPAKREEELGATPPSCRNQKPSWRHKAHKGAKWDDDIEILGSWVQCNGENDKDITERLRKARKVWYHLCNYIPGLKVSRSQRRNVFQATVLASLLYGCEVQGFSKKQVGVLRRFINRCLRGLTGTKCGDMKGKLTITDVRRSLQMRDIETIIASRTLR